MAVIKWRWICSACKKEHKDRSDALECCPPYEEFTCGKCGKTYRDYPKARGCCEEEGEKGD
jgi:hypothetical protein